MMLADGVEAAVRALQNPTRRKIQGVLQEIVTQKILDGQLDESALTQSDLAKIRDSFDTTLRGLVGHRIPYPERDVRYDRRTSDVAGLSPSRSVASREVGGDGAAAQGRPGAPPSAAALRARNAPSDAGSGSGRSGEDPGGGP